MIDTKTPSAAHTLTLPWVERATASFVKVEAMREAFSLALAAGLNLIFSGPGGHAKSEFLTSAFGAISDTEPYVKSFGQGTSSEELYGGLDFDALNRPSGATIQFNPELSFLEHYVAVFEELFDAPPRVLTSLKDTLTARELRNGHQRFPMATKMIAAATNHSPQDIAEGGPEIAALVERFPVQLEVKWSSYNENDFMSLFTAVANSEQSEPETVTWQEVADLQQRTDKVSVSQSMQRFLAGVIVELRRDGVDISPRTAVFAMQLTRAAAAINGRTTVIPFDVQALTFLPGAYKVKDRLLQVIEEHANEIAAEEALAQLETEFATLETLRSSSNDIQDNEGFIDLLQGIKQQTQDLRVTSRLFGRRSHLSGKIINTIDQLKLEKERKGQAERLREILQEAKRIHNSLRYVDLPSKQDAYRRLNQLQGELGGMPYQLHSSHDDLYREAVVVVNTANSKKF